MNQVAAFVGLVRFYGLSGWLSREHVSRASLQRVLAGGLIPGIVARLLHLIHVGRVGSEITATAASASVRLLPSLWLRRRLSARAAITVGIAHEASGTTRLRSRRERQIVLFLRLQLIHILLLQLSDNLGRRLYVLLLDAGALLVNACGDG